MDFRREQKVVTLGDRKAPQKGQEGCALGIKKAPHLRTPPVKGQEGAAPVFSGTNLEVWGGSRHL